MHDGLDTTETPQHTYQLLSLREGDLQCIFSVLVSQLMHVGGAQVFYCQQ